MSVESETRITHQGVDNGWPHNRWGEPFDVPRNEGEGHPKCMCGELGPELYTGRSRRAWLREHRESKVDERLGRTSGRELQNA